MKKRTAENAENAESYHLSITTNYLVHLEHLLLVGKEEAQLKRFRTEQAESKAAKLAAKLRELGINPDDDL